MRFRVLRAMVRSYEMRSASCGECAQNSEAGEIICILDALDECEWLPTPHSIALTYATSQLNLTCPPFDTHLDILLTNTKCSNQSPILLRIHQLDLCVPHISGERKSVATFKMVSTLNVLIKLGTTLYISRTLMFFPRHR